MLNKVNLSYRKTVTYVKSGEVLTKFDREVFESWLKEEVETSRGFIRTSNQEGIEDLERNIDSVIDEHDRREWSEVDTTYEQFGFDHQSDENYSGEGSFDKSIQMWMDKKKIESLTQQVESLTQKLESSTF